MVSSFEELGKTAGKDKESNKLTYVSLYGLKEAKNKFDSHIKNCCDIIEKYDSDIISNIIKKLTDRLSGV